MTETGDFHSFGFQQAKEPKFGEVAVGPALVVSASPRPLQPRRFLKMERNPMRIHLSTPPSSLSLACLK
jgi:hypothetical protein